jgi:hypothetical protein
MKLQEITTVLWLEWVGWELSQATVPPLSLDMVVTMYPTSVTITSEF